MSKYRGVAALAVAGFSAFGLAACGSSSSTSSNIRVDGSSTVFPLAQSAAETFNQSKPDVKITVGQSGTGGGFQKFCAGEIDVADASRAIHPEEAAACKSKGITFQQIQVANDGIAVVANPALGVNCLTVAQLKQIWSKGSTVTSLSQVDPKLSSQKLSLFGPGSSHGTFEFFTEKINGTKKVSRTDYQPADDDNQLVTGVEGDKGGFGYFGYSFAAAAGSKLTIVGMNDGKGCIKPSVATVQDGSYTPLSRPLYMYVNEKSLGTNSSLSDFLTATVNDSISLATKTKLVPLTSTQLTGAQASLATAEKNATK